MMPSVSAVAITAPCPARAWSEWPCVTSARGAGRSGSMWKPPGGQKRPWGVWVRMSAQFRAMTSTIWERLADAARRARPSRQAEPQRRDPEEREEADHVRHRRDERAGRDGRVGPGAVEGERDQDAGERRRQKVRDHGEPDHDAEPGVREPQRGQNPRDQGEADAVEEADRGLAQDDAGHVPGAEVAGGER